MSSDEEKQILKMVEAGKISADEAMRLIKALEEDTAEVEIELIEPEAGSGSGFETNEGSYESAAPEFEEIKARARRLAMIPLGIGIVLTVLASYWLFVLVQNANYGFWFACAWFPMMLGILLLALSAGGMNARWLYVNVDQAPGQRPEHITLGFPVPLGLIGWLLRTFGNFIPGMDRQRVEEILTLLATADAHGPLIVNVDEGERGERVQVYIG
jgi:hypothetical protein